MRLGLKYINYKNHQRTTTNTCFSRPCWVALGLSCPVGLLTSANSHRKAKTRSKPTWELSRRFKILLVDISSFAEQAKYHGFRAGGASLAGLPSRQTTRWQVLANEKFLRRLACALQLLSKPLFIKHRRLMARSPCIGFTLASPMLTSSCCALHLQKLTKRFGFAQPRHLISSSQSFLRYPTGW